MKRFVLFTDLFSQRTLGFYIDKYNTWSSYQPEDEGILVASASIHGTEKKAAELLSRKLKAGGAEVAFDRPLQG